MSHIITKRLGRLRLCKGYDIYKQLCPVSTWSPLAVAFNTKPQELRSDEDVQHTVSNYHVY